MLIKDFMEKNPITCPKETTIQEAAKLMKKNRIGVLLVTKNNYLKGVISERDIINKVVSNNKPNTLLVKDIMTKKVITSNETTTDIKAAKLFNKHNIKKLPILKNKKLVGIITQTDLLKVAALKYYE